MRISITDVRGVREIINRLGRLLPLLAVGVLLSLSACSKKDDAPAKKAKPAKKAELIFAERIDAETGELTGKGSSFGPGWVYVRIKPKNSFGTDTLIIQSKPRNAKEWDDISIAEIQPDWEGYACAVLLKEEGKHTVRVMAGGTKPLAEESLEITTR